VGLLGRLGMRRRKVGGEGLMVLERKKEKKREKGKRKKKNRKRRTLPSVNQKSLYLFKRTGQESLF
jgi:hypothetical protein